VLHPIVRRTHHWCRCHASGHDSRLIVAQYSKPKSNVGKNGVSDATATAEVMIRLRSTAISRITRSPGGMARSAAGVVVVDPEE
jgi:hypothetical protein